MSTHDKQSGFILYSTLMSITISTIVLTLLLGIVFYGVMWNAKLIDSVAMMEDGGIQGVWLWLKLYGILYR